MNRSLIPLVITLVSWQLVGCGGPANDTGSAKSQPSASPTGQPEQSSVTAATEGTAATTDKPIDAETTPPEPKEPATVAEAAAVLKLTEFAQPKDAHNASTFLSMLFYMTYSDVDQAADFVRKELEKHGLKLAMTQPTRAASLTFNKDDKPPASVRFSQSSGDKEQTFVTINHWVDFDVSQIPVPERSGKVYRKKDELSYTAPLSLEKAVEWYRGELKN